MDRDTYSKRLIPGAWSSAGRRPVFSIPGAPMPDRAAVKAYLLDLQRPHRRRSGSLDGKPFQTDSWTAPARRRWLTRLIEDGNFFERGGCNFSRDGRRSLPPSPPGAACPELAGRSYEAMGVSLVLHPATRTAPPLHERALLHCQQRGARTTYGGSVAAWTSPLTSPHRRRRPPLPRHLQGRHVLPWGEAEYRRPQDWCDRYFFLKHRNEPVAWAACSSTTTAPTARWISRPPFAMTRSVGDALLPAAHRRTPPRYAPRRTSERDFKPIARAVTWNSTWFDRGNLFRLQSGGRTESILMSMLPIVKWRYDWQPGGQRS